MIRKLKQWWQGKTQSSSWEDVRQKILDAVGEMKVRFEVTPYYYKVTSGKRTWYWNKDTGEFDGTSWQIEEKPAGVHA